MTARQQLTVLDEIPDTGEIVIRPYAYEGGADALLEAWRNAHADADLALDQWGLARTRSAFAAYRAAEDRADAAQDALASRRSS